MDINTCLATTIDYRDLALYSHLIPAAAALILGVFAYLKAANRHKASIFLIFTITFALWLIGDLIVWTTNSYSAVATFWAPLDYIEIVFFLLLFYFVYVDFYKTRSEPLEIMVIVAAVVPLFITLSGQAVLEFYQPVCEMEGNSFLANYKVALEGLILLGVSIMALYQSVKNWGNWNELTRVGLVALAIVLFMGVFGGSEYVATSTDIFEINLYALFTLPIFILMLTMAIVNYGTFKLGDAAVRVLFYIFLTLAATQFFFAGDLIEFLLASMSFGVVLVLGLMLFFTSEREIRQRHIIETQAKELQMANKQQESLLHFIGHEIKGYLTESVVGFSSIAEGDFGPVPDKLKAMATSALANTRRGVATVMDILDASNLKRGTVNYAKKSFDFRKAITTVVEELKPAAQQKGVSIELSMGEGEYGFVGDEEKIKHHILRNLIDNAIKYTPHGTVHVSLTDGKVVRFSVKDSGVGVTPEDMRNLFTEGGHGKDSIKINVHSTGYGLFIAKQVVDAHHGKIWAESEGAGKGSTFIVEFPIS